MLVLPHNGNVRKVPKTQLARYQNAHINFADRLKERESSLDSKRTDKHCLSSLLCHRARRNIKTNKSQQSLYKIQQKYGNFKVSKTPDRLPNILSHLSYHTDD